MKEKIGNFKIDINEIKNLPNKQGICPMCKSTNLDYEAVEFEGDMCYFPYKCKDCNTEGEEWYNLTFTGHNLITEDGSIIELNN